MAAKWQQWMPLKIDAFRASPAVQAMHPAARAGYIYLLLSAWQTDDCTVSADPIDLAEISGLGDDLWNQYSAKILRNFSVLPCGKLQNNVCFEEWSRAKFVFEARQDAAKRTTKIRSSRQSDTVTVDDLFGDDTVTVDTPLRSDDTITGTDTGTLTVKQKHPSKEEIENLYKAYPKHEAKAPSLKAIEKALRKKPFDELLPIVQVYAAKTEKQIAEGKLEKQYIPLPSTWFNQERYEDDDLKPPPQYEIVEVTPEKFWAGTGIHVS
jgi:uncharacterized protein YdaU (DUF1376 family)